MRLIRLVLLRSMRLRPLRTILSVFGIVIGVASIVAIGLTNQAALDSVTQVFQDTSGKANLIVLTSVSDAQGFPESALHKVLGVSTIDTVAPSLQMQTILSKDTPASEIGLNFFGVNLGGLSLYGIDPLVDVRIRPYRIIEGQFLSNKADAYEIVLVQDYAREEDLTVGKWVEILTPHGFKKLRLVGLMAKEGPGLTNNGSFGVIPLQTAQKLFDRSNELDQIDILTTKNASSGPALDSLKSGLQSRLGKDYSVLYPASQGERMAQMLQSYQIGLNFMSGIALFVGAFLIYNAFTMTVIERTREIGLLRTVGMTRMQVTGQVVLEAVLLGILGSALGALLGVLMARGLSYMMGILIGQNLSQIDIDSNILGIAAGVGVAATFLSAVIPAFQASRISPLEALRVHGRSRESWLVRQGWKLGVLLLAVSAFVLIANPFPYEIQLHVSNSAVILLFLGGTLVIPVTIGAWEWGTRPLMRLIYGSSGRIGSSNIQRSRLRTTLTVAALMVGVAMILIVQAMTSSFSGDLTAWIDAYTGGDMYVASSMPMRSNIARRLELVDGVAYVAPIRYIDVKWRTPDGQDEPVTFMGIDPAVHSRVTSFVFSGEQTDVSAALNRLAAGDAVFLSSVLAEKYGIHAGDQVQLRTRMGLRPFEVAAINVDFYNRGMTITGNWNDLYRYFGVNTATAYMLKTEPGYNIEQVQSSIKSQYGDRYHLTVESNAAIQERVTQLINQAFSMFDVLSMVSILIAAMGIVNTMTMNVIERRREIGMLRSMGMTRWQVVRMILSEAGLIGLIGGLLGLAFGIVLSRVLFLAMMAMSGYSLTYVLPVRGVFTALAVTLLISQLAAAFPSRRAARTDILEAIQYE